MNITHTEASDVHFPLKSLFLDEFSQNGLKIMKKPQKIILFNLDGIFEIFLQLENSKQRILAKSIKTVFEQLDGENSNIIKQ